MHSFIAINLRYKTFFLEKFVSMGRYQKKNTTKNLLAYYLGKIIYLLIHSPVVAYISACE